MRIDITLTVQSHYSINSIDSRYIIPTILFILNNDLDNHTHTQYVTSDQVSNIVNDKIESGDINMSIFKSIETIDPPLGGSKEPKTYTYTGPDIITFVKSEFSSYSGYSPAKLYSLNNIILDISIPNYLQGQSIIFNSEITINVYNMDIVYSIAYL